ncbi:MAG: AraC family transcriptional regulator [Nostoc desertorum CM1-VF14]|jgi:YesN/AraC family two-component response regulator|nr:AraC family transcriptional regulator [Nostoc desertorum CM1-VF14]
MVKILVIENVGAISIQLEKHADNKKYYAGQFQQTPVLPSSTTAIALNCQSIFPSNSNLRHIFEYIEANYHQSISLNDVALAVGYCPAYLTDLVRRHTGQTVNTWITERRMAAARTLLLESNLCINRIAETVGYQHEGYFFRQFRQYHGTTPQAWRKAHKTVF